MKTSRVVGIREAVFIQNNVNWILGAPLREISPEGFAASQPQSTFFAWKFFPSVCSELEISPHKLNA